MINIIFLLLGLFRQIKSIFGEINVVVNNAGINGEDIWEKVIQVNLVRDIG